MAETMLETYPVHLGRGGVALIEPAFTGGLEWYAGYELRHVADGPEGRLVSLFCFDRPWTTWEMHPEGAEVVLCLSGTISLHQEQADGSVVTTSLRTGGYVINPAGVWHTADADAPASALFITPGRGTEVRAR